MKKLLFIGAAAALLTACRKDEKKPLAFKVNEENSKAEWKGSARDHFHIGSFDIHGGLSAMSDGTVTGGDFDIPIASIKNFDLPDDVKPVLLADLKDNFFKIVLHPNASFHVTGVTRYDQTDTAAVAGANYLLTGDFSMVGNTHPIRFPAKIEIKGDSLTAEAIFNLDRTKWGMDNYSDDKQQLYIYPDVNIHLNIHAAKEAGR